MLNFSRDKLESICKDMYIIEGLTISFWDEKMNLIYAYPSFSCDFCSYIREFDVLSEKCLNSDKAGFIKCRKEKKICVYKCHMGLTEAIAPIIHNNIILGYIMIGQAPEKSNLYDIEKKIDNVSQDLNLDKSYMLTLLKHMNILDTQKIISSANILNILSNYLWMNNILRVQQDSTFYLLDEYISNNLEKDLSIKKLCDYLHVSRSKLYAISKNNYKFGISEHIKILRMEKAKKLLTDGANVAETSEIIGISDPNYFIKLFKSHTGLTPLRYKKLHCDEYKKY